MFRSTNEITWEDTRY
uniref:Uncharacterized protein n=1 Tax=Anguilla anguilla TaxID=7936 RepID=A0A0E9T2E5_ANGAN